MKNYFLILTVLFGAMFISCGGMAYNVGLLSMLASLLGICVFSIKTLGSKESVGWLWEFFIGWLLGMFVSGMFLSIAEGISNIVTRNTGSFNAPLWLKILVVAVLIEIWGLV